MRTTYLPTPVGSGALRIAPLAKAVVDSCLIATEAGDATRAEALADAAISSGRVSIAELEDELTRAPRRYSGNLRAHLSRQRKQARDDAASRFLEALGSAGPFGSLQDVAVYAGNERVARAVALWPTRTLAAAVDAPEHEVRTLSNLGFAVMQIAPRQIMQDLGGVLRQVGAALMSRPEATLPHGISLLPRASASAAPAPRTSASRAPTSHASRSRVSEPITSAPRVPAPRTSASRAFESRTSVSQASAPRSSAPRATASNSTSGSAAQPARPASPAAAARATQRVLIASSPARTGTSSVLPRGGRGHT